MTRCAALILAAGCGRFGFSETPAGTSIALAVSAANGVSVTSMEARVELGALDPNTLFPLPAGGGTPDLPGEFGIVVPDVAGSANVTVDAIDARGRALTGSGTTEVAIDQQASVSIVIGDSLAAACLNGVKDAGESDVDCGGPCPACGVGSACTTLTDCGTEFCAAQVCELAYGPPGWLPIADMPTSRIGAGASLGADGRVYVYGGSIADSVAPLTELDIYDSTTDTWTVGSPLLTATHRLGGVTAPDGAIYAYGGSAAGGDIANVQKLVRGAAQWIQMPPLPTGRDGFAGVIDGGGNLYAFGGTPTDTGSVMFNGAAWSTRAPLPSPRTNVVGVTAADGTLVVIGGHDLANTVFFDTVEAYTPTTDSWQTLPPLSIARSDLAGARGPDGRMYAISGFNGNPAATVEAYRPGAAAWLEIAPVAVARDTCSATVAADGRILVFGGKASPNTAYTSVEAYGPTLTFVVGASTDAPGATIAVSGHNFGANAHVHVSFDGLPAVLGATDGTGTLAPVTVHVATLTAGTHTIGAVDDHSRYPVTAAFAVQ